MMKIALVVWIMLGTTLAGIALAAIVSVPEFSSQAMRLIPLFCVAGFLVALPVSWIVAKKIDAQARSA